MPGILVLFGSLLLLAPQAELKTPPPVSNLVTQLGSKKFSEREAASKTLIEYGRNALPALSRARKSQDPEVQLRADFLMDRIERTMLFRPTLVRLTPGERNFSEILKEVRDQSGFRFEIDPGGEPTWIERRIKIEERPPSDFWALLTSLGLRGNWVLDQESPVFGVRLEPSFHIAPKPMNAQVDRTSSGPLCLVLRRQELDRAIGPGGRRRPGGNAFPTDPVPEDVAEAVTLRMELMSEPRIQMKTVSDVRVTQATDASGANLAFSDQNNAFIEGPPSNFALPGTSNTVWPFSVNIKRPAGTSPKLRDLVIDLDAELETRRFEPFELQLNLATGSQEFPTPVQFGELTIQRARFIKIPGMNGDSLELVARTEGWAEMAIPRRGNRRRVDLMSAELERIVANVEVVDSNGKLYRFGPNRSVQFDPLEFRVTLGLVGNPENGPPSTLRFFGNIRDTAHFRFEFHDVELQSKR